LIECSRWRGNRLGRRRWRRRCAAQHECG
jgi:hypothetical protein